MLVPYPHEAGMNSGFARRPAGARSLNQWGCGRMRTFVRALSLVVALGGAVVAGGCGARPAAWHGAGSAPPSASPSPAPVAVITAPADGATEVSTATELALSGATASTPVTLTDASGAPVAGALRPDRSSWVPAAQLTYATTYTAEVAGRKVTFHTMARPAALVRASTPLADGAVYGVALPLVVRFDTAVPVDRRAEVERRLFVTAVPDQPGAWNWFGGTEVHYRPKDYWQAGTRLSLRVATGGLAMGGRGYGGADLTIHASIGDKLLMITDNAAKSMTVTRDDQVLRTIPVSLGRPDKPSSSGAMVVMSKARSELFVGTDPGDEYRITAYWTQRLTADGEYIHAAPWSVGSQGRRNVSHGCTNMSTDNARWLWGLTHVGDPVIVKGTGSSLDWGNGWTDWDRPWDRYLQGSALAHSPSAP